MSPFRLLLNLFQGRFFESDDVTPGSGFQTNLTQVLGILLTSGFVVGYLTIPAYSYASNHHRGVGPSVCATSSPPNSPPSPAS
jgi:hypothetical protein